MNYALTAYKKIRIILLFFCLALQIQQLSAQSYDTDNDNWRYFYDIALESGIYIPIENSFPSGSITSLSGSYFWNDKLGVRSGVSLITGMDGSDKYFKVPFLFSFRTRTFTSDWNSDEDYENFGEMLVSLLLHVLPTRLELNIGPSFGYMTPGDSETYTYINGKEVLRETADIRHRFASSLDANARLSFQFWRICVTGNFGVNYLLTRNYDYRLYTPREEKHHPSWFANLGLGVSYRF